MSGWLSNTDNSNRIKSIYVKGFVDIKDGDLKLRNGNLYVGNDANIQGNVIINNSLGIGTIPNFPFDISGNANFRNNLYISNDLSLNNRLFVIGDVSMNNNLFVVNSITGTMNTTSDYRIKQNIQSLTLSSFNIDSLRPVMYDNKLTKKTEFGLIAHEVQELFPFVVNGEKDGPDYQSVNYVEFISLLIHEVQQMKQSANSLLPLMQITQHQHELISGLQKQIDNLQNNHNNDSENM